MCALKIDTHQHFWNLSKVDYAWLAPAYGPIYNNFAPQDLEPQLRKAGIDKTVLVQSANNTEDTVSMLTQAECYDWIGGVVGWVPLYDHAVANRLLDRYAKHPKWRGVRHLNHEEADPDWLVRKDVLGGIKLLEERGMTLDVVAIFPKHIGHVPTIANHAPNLKVVIDHLAKPPIKAKKIKDWKAAMKAAAQCPNVYAKVSGLNTAANWANWSADDLKPYIDATLELFGAERCMFGSDWPVAILAGDYAKVWRETKAALKGYGKKDVDAVLGGTAQQVYRVQN
jgi:L-fuconolactonase